LLRLPLESERLFPAAHVAHARCHYRTHQGEPHGLDTCECSDHVASGSAYQRRHDGGLHHHSIGLGIEPVGELLDQLRIVLDMILAHRVIPFSECRIANQDPLLRLRAFVPATSTRANVRTVANAAPGLSSRSMAGPGLEPDRTRPRRPWNLLRERRPPPLPPNGR